MEIKDKQEKVDTFYRCVVGLMLKDYKEKGITLEEAERLYRDWNIVIIFKNGKIDFEVIK